jgi:hypothetical protein
MMTNLLEQSHPEKEAAPGFVDGLLTGLRGIYPGLTSRLKAGVRVVWPFRKRESSAWFALRAEYSPHEPITEGFDPDIDLPRLQHYNDPTFHL